MNRAELYSNAAGYFGSIIAVANVSPAAADSFHVLANGIIGAAIANLCVRVLNVLGAYIVARFKADAKKRGVELVLPSEPDVKQLKDTGTE